MTSATISAPAASAAAEPQPPAGKRYHCELSACGWHHDAPPKPAISPRASIAEVKTLRAHHLAVKTILDAHYATHRPGQYIGEIMRLRNLCADLTDTLLGLGQEVRAPYTSRDALVPVIHEAVMGAYLNTTTADNEA